ncbi:MAG: hypothetical protein WCG98_09640, partial [bacterium]
CKWSRKGYTLFIRLKNKNKLIYICMTKVERNPESILGWYRNLPGEEKKMILALSVPVISLIIILGAHYLPLVLTGLGRLW